MIRVVCGVIYDGNKVLICRRKQEKSLGGLWEFPGGKVEGGEKLEECLKRELREELQMEIDIKSKYKTVRHKYDDFTIELISFLCDFKSALYNLSDHDAYEWVSPSDLLDYQLASADVPIAKKLQLEEYLK